MKNKIRSNMITEIIKIKDKKEFNKILEKTTDILKEYIQKKKSYEEYLKGWMKLGNFLEEDMIISEDIIQKNQKNEKKSQKGWASNIYEIEQNTIIKKIYMKKPYIYNNEYKAKNCLLEASVIQGLIQKILYEKSNIRCVPKMISIDKINNEEVNLTMEKVHGDVFVEEIFKNSDRKWLKRNMEYFGLLFGYLQKEFYFVHGDLSTNNLMINKKEQIIIIDFGNANIKINNDWLVSDPKSIENNYIPNNKMNESKSVDIFYYILDLFYWNREKIEKNKDKLKDLIRLYNELFTIKDKKMNLGKIYFEYFIDKNKDTIKPLTKMSNMYKYMEIMKKKDSRYKVITKEDILEVRRRFEPINFIKIVKEVL